MELIRKIMSTSRLGAKLNLSDVLVAAKTMSVAKKMDLNVLKGIVRIQFPQILNKIESDYFDWFNLNFERKQEKKKRHWIWRYFH